MTRGVEMSNERWQYTRRYLCDVFGREEGALATVTARALEAGLPDIAVDGAVGRLLTILCATTNGGRGARFLTSSSAACLALAASLSFLETWGCWASPRCLISRRKPCFSATLAATCSSIV